MKASYLLRIVLLLFVIYCLNSCQEDKFNDITYVQENEDIPIKSLDNSRGVTDGTTYPSGQNDVIASVVNKKLVCCRLASDNAITHAVVLVGLDNVKRQLLYYDPVYGGEENRIAYYKIYDPRIINSLISPDL